MSPILVRPVREQFEHDRVIRVLQTRYKRKYEVAINPGAEQNASVSVGEIAMYPDLLLYSEDRGRKLHATIEVETTESINTLEAMAEWGPFSRLKTPFFLYVPWNSIETVRRLCAEHQVEAAEIWTYHAAVDQIRFTMVHRAQELVAAVARAKSAPKPESKSALKSEPKSAVKPEPKAAAKPEPKSAPKPEPKTSAKSAAPRPAIKPKGASSPAESRGSQAAKKPIAAAKKAAKPAKPVPKSATKPATKPAPKKPAKPAKRR